MNLEEYLPILLFILVGIAAGILPQVLGCTLAPHRPNDQKLSPYERGFEAFDDARMKCASPFLAVHASFPFRDVFMLHGVPAPESQPSPTL